MVYPNQLRISDALNEALGEHGIELEAALHSRNRRLCICQRLLKLGDLLSVRVFRQFRDNLKVYGDVEAQQLDQAAILVRGSHGLPFEAHC